MKRIASILLLVGFLTGCATAIQMEMDAEVDRLCAIDGGLKIYETVSLPPEKFNEYGQINFFNPTLKENALGSEYVWRWDVKYLQPGGDSRANPRMWRDHIQVFRRSDSKLLGESVSYVRFGGNPEWTQHRGYHSSHYSCPINIGEHDFFKRIFNCTKTGVKNGSTN